MKKLNLKLFINRTALKYFFITLMLTIFQVACMIAIPILLNYFNILALPNGNYFFGNLDRRIQILLLILLLSVIACILFGFGYAANRFSIRFAKTVATNMRSIAYSNIQKFSSIDVEFFGQSSIVNRLTIDTNNVAIAMEVFTRMLFKSIITYFGALIGLIVVVTGTSNNISTSQTNGTPPWLILIIVVIISVVLLVIIIMLGLLSQKSFTHQQKSLDEINFVAQENVIGQKAVKSFVLQDKQFECFSNANEGFRKWATKAGYIMAGMLPTIYFFLDTSMLIVVWLSNKETIKVIGSMFLLIGLMVIALILSIIGIVQVNRALPSYFRILDISVYEPQIKYPSKPVKLSNKHDIVVKNLSYCFPNSSTPAISNIDFTINQGDVVGIIGPTGSGKSTLISLLMRMYDCSSGTIELSGADIKKFDKHQLKQSIAYCPQNIVLFEGTIKSNILFGDNNATLNQIESAAKSACLYDLVMSKPDKYDSVVAQRGKNLSGGQKQRLCLARSLVRSSPYLFLDDATSALDMLTEKTICDELIKNKKKQTIIIASQRITAIKNMKKIIVIQDGKISAMGTHNQLLKQCEYYRNVAIAQLGEKEVINELS